MFLFSIAGRPTTLLLLLYKQPIRCNDKNLLIFQSTQHASGDNFTHPQEH